MSTPQFQQMYVKGPTHQTLFHSQQVTNRTGHKDTHSTDHDENSNLINDKIAHNLKTKEQSVLLKYLSEKKDSTLRIKNGTKSFRSPNERLEESTSQQKLKKTRLKYPSEITKPVYDHQRAKTNEKTPNRFTRFNEHTDKQREIFHHREKLAVSQARGDFSNKTDSRQPAALKSPLLSHRTDRKVSNLDVKMADKTESGHDAIHARKSGKQDDFSKWNSNNICVPRAVQSDLTERRSKAALTVSDLSALMVTPRPPPPPRPDVPRHRPTPCTNLLAAIPATIFNPLRETASDAKVAEACSTPTTRRSTRQRKAPTSSRPPRVRAPRPLKEFLRAGFHPPEPGVSASARGPRRLRPTLSLSDGGPLPDADAAPGTPGAPGAPDAAGALAAGAPDLSVYLSSLPYTGSPQGSATGQRETDSPPDNNSGPFQNEYLNAAARRLRELRDRPTVHLPCSTMPPASLPAPTPNLPAPNLSQPTTKRPRSAAPELGDPSDTSRLGVAKQAVDPQQPFVCLASGLPSIHNVLTGLRNKKGKVIVRTPTKYRSVPLLKGQLYPTMPSIREETESAETNSPTDDESENKPNTEEGKGCNRMEKFIKDAKQSNARYWHNVDKLVSGPLNEESTKKQLERDVLKDVGDENQVRTDKKKRPKTTEEKQNNEDEKRNADEQQKTNEEETDNKKSEIDPTGPMSASRTESSPRFGTPITSKEQGNKTGKLTKEEEAIRTQRKLSVKSHVDRMKKGGMRTKEKKLSGADDKKAKEWIQRKKTEVGNRVSSSSTTTSSSSRRITSSTSSGKAVSSTSKVRVKAKPNRMKLRRSFRREVKAVAECVKAERVMARWLQNQTAVRKQKEMHERMESGGGAGGGRAAGGDGASPAPRRRRISPRKHAAAAARGGAAEGKRPESKRHSEQWLQAKSAVRHGEMQLLATAERLAQGQHP